MLVPHKCVYKNGPACISTVYLLPTTSVHGLDHLGIAKGCSPIKYIHRFRYEYPETIDLLPSLLHY